jgi:two-component sensor histidine kinase
MKDLFRRIPTFRKGQNIFDTIIGYLNNSRLLIKVLISFFIMNKYIKEGMELMKALSQSARNSFKITLVYFTISAFWIFFSDRALGMFFSDSSLLMEMQTYKGWFFVLITSVLLYYLIRQSTMEIEESRNKMSEALKEKKAVLSELHHRVKNNLAIICGLIDLQINELKDVHDAKVLETTRYRIFTLAEIEELFYQSSDMSSIPFHEFIKDLINSLNESGDLKYQIKSEVDDLYLSISQAVPFGLVLNEIFTQFRLNGHKNEVNAIDVSLVNTNSGKVSLELVFDNVPSRVISQLTDTRHIETILLDLYSQQLHATANWLKENGLARYVLDFEKSADETDSPTMLK